MPAPNLPKPNVLERLLLWTKRHRTAVIASIAGIAAIIGCACVLTDPGSALGDAGGFAGSSSYGGGGYSGGGYSGGGYFGGGTTHYYGSGGVDMVDIIVLLVIIFLVFVLPKILSSGSAPASRGPQPAGASKTPESQLRPLEELKARDPNFSASEIEALITGVYVQMQQNWTRKNFEPMRPYFDNKLFSQFSNQLAQMTAAGKTNYVDNIAVLETRARGWYESQGNEYLVLRVRTRITDYTIDDRTGQLVGGFKDRESYMEYEYILSRSAGTKTPAMPKAIEAGQCPHCGAPINLVQNAKCEYCGSVIESKRHTWVISAIKGVSQQIV